MFRRAIPCRQNREAARQATIMSPVGSVRHRTHSLLSTVTMKPFCNIAASDSRRKTAMKISTGKGSIFSREGPLRLGFYSGVQGPTHLQGKTASLAKTLR